MKIWKYKIIEYEYTKMTNKEIETAKTLHKTNSKLLCYLIILCLKINKIKYDVVKER